MFSKKFNLFLESKSLLRKQILVIQSHIGLKCNIITGYFHQLLNVSGVSPSQLSIKGFFRKTELNRHFFNSHTARNPSKRRQRKTTLHTWCIFISTSVDICLKVDQQVFQMGGCAAFSYLLAN